MMAPSEDTLERRVLHNAPRMLAYLVPSGVGGSLILRFVRNADRSWITDVARPLLAGLQFFLWAVVAILFVLLGCAMVSLGFLRLFRDRSATDVPRILIQ